MVTQKITEHESARVQSALNKISGAIQSDKIDVGSITEELNAIKDIAYAIYERQLSSVATQETELCVKCHKRPSYNGNWCDRCEMADRAWQVEVWDKHRINNADAIFVYGFKSRVDMEEAWYEAGLADREARYKYQIR